MFPGNTLIKDVPAGSFPAARMALVISDPRKNPEVEQFVAVEFAPLRQLELETAVQLLFPTCAEGTIREEEHMLVVVVTVVEVVGMEVSGE